MPCGSCHGADFALACLVRALAATTLAVMAGPVSVALDPVDAAPVTSSSDLTTSRACCWRLRGLQGGTWILVGLILAGLSGLSLGSGLIFGHDDVVTASGGGVEGGEHGVKVWNKAQLGLAANGA